VTRYERETECCEWLFVVAASVRGPEVVGARSQFGVDLTNRPSDRRVINEAVRRRPSITSYNQRDLIVSYNKLRFPMDFKPTQAQIQLRLLAKLDRGATNMISFGGLFTAEIAESHGCNSVPHSF
jgi:hypothetical protein